MKRSRPSTRRHQAAAFAAAASILTHASAFSVSSMASTRKELGKGPSPSLELPPSAESSSPLEEMQARHRPIASSFEPGTFDPHPALTNNHLQTILGVYLRKQCGYISPGVKGLQEFLVAVQDVAGNDEKRTDESICDFYDERIRITTPCDTDFFSVDVRYSGERERAYQSDEGKGLVILVHGLESNSNSSLSTDLGQAYINQGFDFACINFRGCCGTPNDTINSYHLGFTDDLKYLLKTISDLWSKGDGYEDRPIYLSGFSLGTNVVVKCLGELGEDALSLYNVRGAAVGAAPFDNKLNNLRIDSPGFNKEVYGRNFLKSMKRKAKEKLYQQCDGDPNTDLFDYGRAMSAETIAEYENAYICKVYGFDDNIDYYERTSCKYFLPGVAVPLYIVNAEDDPFFDPSCFPIEEGVDGGGKAPIKMVRTKHGGHLGNLFHQRREGESRPQTSWMPTELARFVGHVHAIGQ